MYAFLASADPAGAGTCVARSDRMLVRKPTIALLLATMLGGAACRDRDDPERASHGKPADDDFTRTRERYEVELRERLDRIDEQLGELARRTDAKAHEAADRLRAERDRLEPQFDELRKQARSGWEEASQRVSRGFDELQRKLDDALDSD